MADEEKGVLVTVEDRKAGTIETVKVQDDYLLITQGNRYLDGIQSYPTTGTTVLTIKTGTPS